MPQELLAALVGAAISGLLMVLANRSSRRQGDIRELFHRMNSVEQSIARLEVTKRDPQGWRKR